MTFVALWFPTLPNSQVPFWRGEKNDQSTSLSAPVRLHLYPLRSQIVQPTAPSCQILQHQLSPGCVFHPYDPFFFFFRLFYLGFLHLFELKFYFLRFCSFLVLKESGKLFLHGCYNNKLLLNEIHARPDQYCFWWCLRQSGSFIYEFPDLFGGIFYVFLFYALLPKISTYCEN